MREPYRRLRRIAADRRFDPVAAAGLAVAVLAWQAAAGDLADQTPTVPVFVALLCGALAVARRRPFAAAALVTCGLALAGLSGHAGSLTGAVNVLEFVPLLVAYLLGLEASIAAGLAGVALMAAGLQALGGAFNPLFEMVTLGPWLAGRAVGSRRRLAGRIADRNRELADERVAFARESVRHERARIARELHDAVGHCLSVIVVQAGAGQRLAAAEPVRTADVFDAILEAAGEADAELLLLTRRPSGADETGPEPARALEGIGELVRRAGATGVRVRYVAAPALPGLDPRVSEVAYRVVQEGLTNSLKHAPGAPIDVSLRHAAAAIEVGVTTAASGRPRSEAALAGGGRGLTGMADRVNGCGGTLTAGPTPSGGWHVLARLPRRPAEPVH